MPINSFLYPGAKVVTGYEVANSLRFNDGSSDYLNRTPSGGNYKVATFSAWFKRSSLGSEQHLISFRSNDNLQFNIKFQSDDCIRLTDYGFATNMKLVTNRKFRDTSAWYHIVASFDSTQSTASDRANLWINGVQETSFSTETYPSQNGSMQMNGNVSSNLVGAYSSSFYYFDGYMTEVVWIDGTQLDETSFGEFDSDTGIWKPIDVSDLTFGTNGFYLDFEDSSALGNDVSGNDNDFTVNNLTSIDQTTDTCTNNFCTLNPLHFGTAGTSNTALSEGNLKFVSTQGGSPYPYYISTMAVSEGKWYAEFKFVSSDSGTAGIGNGVADQYAGNNAYDYSYYFDGRLYNNGSGESTGYSAISNNDILGCALDLDNNKIYFHINGTYQASGDPTAGTGGKSITASVSNGTGFYHFEVGDAGANQPTIECNFGNPTFSISSGNSDGNGYGNFEYSVPSGYYALNTKNLSEYG
jgi:hypothetical protein